MQTDTVMTDEEEEGKEMIPKRRFCLPFSFPVSP